MSDVSRLNINLEHRQPTLHDGLGIIGNTKEAIDHSVWRSLAILRTLSNFALNEPNELTTDTLYWSIDAVINELQDIEIIIDTLTTASEVARRVGS